MTTQTSSQEQWQHGSRLGREHASVRQHLIEDHGKPAPEVVALSDSGIHGWHDGLHGVTWAYAYDLPHPGDSPFRKYLDGGLALHQQHAARPED